MQENRIDSFCSRFSDKWQKFIESLLKKIFDLQKTLDTKSRINIAIIAMLCIAIFAGMYIANVNTPLAADDFSYNYIYSEDGDPDYPGEDGTFQIGDRVQSVSDIITSMKSHYFNMNGRVFLHFLVQLMLLLGKPLFNVINSAMYVALLLLMYKHCLGKSKNHNAVLFAVIGLAFWTFSSTTWGVTNVWLDGSINYLWGSVIRLAALLPFRLYADSKEEKKPLLFLVPTFILCIAAGATNENTGAAFIGMCVLYLIYYRVKKIKIHLWQITGLFGALAGFAFICLAPANFKRVDTWNQEGGNSLKERIINIPGNYIRFIFVFVAVFFMLSLLLYFYGKEKREYRIGIGFIYLLGSVGGSFIMLTTPYFPERAWSGVRICAILAVGFLLAQIKLTPPVLRLTVTIGAVFWTAWGAMSYVHMIQDAKSVMAQYNQRVEYIEEQKALGNYDIELTRITPLDIRSPLYQLPDLAPESSGWQNVTKSKYYGLRSITTINTR